MALLEIFIDLGDLIALSIIAIIVVGILLLCIIGLIDSWVQKIKKRLKKEDNNGLHT